MKTKATVEIKKAEESKATITKDGKLFVGGKEIVGVSLTSKKWECTFTFLDGDKIVLSGSDFVVGEITLEDHSVSMIMDMARREGVK